MNENNFWGSVRLSGVKVGMIVRIALALFATFGSIALAWTLLNPHDSARASGLVEVPTQKNPWGLVQDGTHVWVAEPGCELNPVCQTQFPSTIGEYTQTNPPVLVANFTEPTGFTSPGFLALDGKGNVWFTEPTSDSIGELTPTGGIWNQWATGITPGSAPFDLTFDSTDNIWFTEARGNNIGFFNTTTHTAVETALPTALSDPYGILYDSTTDAIWFGENGNTMLGSFTPSQTGTITINEYSIGTAYSHMVAIDAAGNIWYSEGPADAVGEYSPTTNHFRDFSVTAAICPTGSSPTCLQNTYVAGVGVDGTGNIWFDEVHTGSVGFLVPPAGAFAKKQTLTQGTTPASSPSPIPENITISAIISSPFDGLIVDGSNDVWVTEKFGSDKLALILPGTLPTPTPVATETTTPSATGTPSGTITEPVSKTWYFAEGKVGAGFTENLTIANPDPVNDCTLILQYFLSGGSILTTPLTVVHESRFTESVNFDLNTPASASTYQIDSAIVTVNSSLSPNCIGVVAERSMYFTKFNGISSGFDVLGATQTDTTFYFADVATGGGYSSFITILNPGTTIANITATFDVGGTTVNTLTLQVPGGTRGTIVPNNTGVLQHAILKVTSDQPVVVERPDYFKNVNEGNAKTVSGASSVVGVRTLKNDWLFSEGNTGGKFQEYLVLANFGIPLITANIILEFSNGHTETIAYTIAQFAQTIVDVNQVVAGNLGTCDTTPCQPTQQVAAEISGTSNFIAEREMFFTYSNKSKKFKVTAMGGTDVIGLSPVYASYSFAEGNTNKGYNELLALQNPTGIPETVSLTLVNGNGVTYTPGGIQLSPHSCLSVDITSLVVQNMVHPGDGPQAYEVYMTVQSNTGPFVAERLMYWNTGSKGTQGGTDVIGYMGS